MNANFSTAIKYIVKDAVHKLFDFQMDESCITVALPPKKEMGDIAVSASFVLAKELKKSPIAIADTIIAYLKEMPVITQATNANGFINITFNDHFFIDHFKNMVLNTDHFVFPSQNITINLEYISSNPTGPLHIGHGRWAALGDSIARLLSRGGYKVMREFYINDAGVQIQKLKESIEALRNNEPIPEGGYHGEYLKDALDSELTPDLFFLEQQKELLARLGVVMDTYYSEKYLADNNKVTETIEVLRKKGFIYEKEGAIWFASSQLGDDKDRPVIKSDGTFTYFAPDIAYHYTKIQRGADWIVDILGADHHGYIKRINAAVQALSDRKVKFNVLLGQLVNLFKNGVPVRMSKRAGNVVMLEDVVNDIGVDATRFMLVSRRYNQMIDFDLEIVKKQTKDNPLFYIQYAFARIQSIKAKINELSAGALLTEAALTETEKNLIIKALFYKEELEETIKEMEPQKIASYLFELSSLFHKFYEKARVIEDDAIISHRLDLINGVANIIKDGLSLLGIEAQNRM